MQTSSDNTRVIIKSINRWARKTQPFRGGGLFGVDYRTWRITYPQISAVYQDAVKMWVKRDGQFMPKF